MAIRKLQGEIERVLKKVDEGVQIFEQIWDKVYSATTTAQKEKYEGDLKKEIKKLQRLRDQIKTWQGDSSIKDKTKLDANRKLIEEKMEKFKVCEKETKTKAFSKEGLAQDRTDPKQKAKTGVSNWVGESIAKLKEQCEEMEAEIETVNSGKRKRRSEENPLVQQLKEKIGRHEHHVEMLERVLRAVYNDAVSPAEAEELKESVDYYIESNQDPDFFEDDEMYDMLNLEATPTPAAVAGKKTPVKANDRGEDEEEHVQTPSASTTLSSKKAPASPRNTRSGKNATATTSGKTQGSGNRVVSPKTTRSSDRSPTYTAPSSPRHPNLASVPTPTPIQTLNSTPHSGPLLSSVVKGNSTTSSTATTPVKPTTHSRIVGTLVPDAPRETPNAREPVTTPSAPSQPAVIGTHMTSAPLLVNNTASTRPRESSGGMFPPPVTESLEVNHVTTVTSTLAATAVTQPSTLPVPLANRPPPLDTEVLTSPTTAGQLGRELGAIERALAFMPDTATPPRFTSASPPAQKSGQMGQTQSGMSGGMTGSTPRNPVKVPSTFPSVATPVFDSREVFEQFDPDTLFFIFYYQQGTYQQYLAATELKRQGWRFHKKYLTWFQRHDEPKRSTDDYEMGTFIYFDYANVVVRGQGTGWCQRIKSEFVFEYRFLEDELE